MNKINLHKAFLIIIAIFALLVFVGCGKEPEPVTEKVTIYFDCDGGSTIDDLEINVGEKILMSQTTHKDGYDLITWVCDDYEFDFETEVTESIWLKAIWLKKYDESSETVVYFNTDGGTYIAPVVVGIGEKITQPKDPIKVGYNFSNWVDEFDESKFNFNNPIEEETYLKSVYDAKKKLTIKFDTDGGEDIEEKIVYIGDKIGKLPVGVKEGFLFLGWYVNGNEITEDFKPDLPVTLKAKFAEIGDGYKYVSFIDYDGKLIEKQKVKMEEGAVAPTVERTGYNLVGWDKDFSYIYEDIEVKAIYEIKSFVVQFKDDNYTYAIQEVKYLEAAVAPALKDIDGFIFSGWDKDFSSITGDLVVKAIWSTATDITDEGKVEHTINLINSKYDGDGSVSKISLVNGEISLGTTVVWESDNSEVISNDGTVTQNYLKNTVTLTANVTSGTYTKKVTYEYVVPRITMDLSTGLSAAYLYSNYGNVNENTLKAFDIYYLAFATFKTTGEVTGLGDYGSTFVREHLEDVHARGAYVVPSFRTTETFAAVSLDPVARVKFAESIVEMINEYDLDGVDIDWEYPNDYDQMKAFVLMMKEIYTRVKANNPKHIVTCAILLGAIDRFTLRESGQYMDYINMMSYEMHSHVKTTHHVALYPSSKGGTIFAVSTSVSSIMNNKIPASKIIVGAGFFGRQYLNSKGIGTTADYQESAPSYATIRREYLDKQTNTLKRYWDDECKVPYIYDSETGLFITYDDPQSIGCKADYVVSKKLGGMMCWQTGQDNGELVQAFIDNYDKLKNIR